MILSFMKKKISLYFYQKSFNQRYNGDFYLTQYLLTKARHNAFILNPKKLTPIPERAYTCNLLSMYVTLIFCSNIQNAKVNHFLQKIIK